MGPKHGACLQALLSKDVVAGMVAAGLAAQQLSQQSGGRPSPHGQAGPWPEDGEGGTAGDGPQLSRCALLGSGR